MTSPRLWLPAITLLAALLRFPALTSVPPSLNLDEVAIGYNAWSIAQTGKDEYNTPFPVAFRSHDDYKAPGYIYLTAGLFTLIGPSDFIVRFSSALLGTLAVPLLYFLVRRLFPKEPPHLGLLSAFFLAISPWHVTFSRAALETNAAVTLVILGLWAYLKGKTHPSFWLLSALAFIASLYTYHSTKLFLPPFFLFLAHDLLPHLRSRFKSLLGLAALSLILLLPLLFFSATPEGSLRFQGTSVFATPTLIDTNRQQLIPEWQAGREWEAKIFHNRYLAGTFVVAKGYLSHFTYDFLFGGQSGPPKNHTPNVGLFYLWQLPFIFIGTYALYRRKLPHRHLILAWLLLAPIASALTWDAPSATRTQLLLPPTIILIALGANHVLNHFQPQFLYRLALISLTLFFFAHFLHNYFRHADIYAEAWQYGYRQAARYTQANQDNYDAVIVSTNLRQPQNFWAWHLRYPPREYLEAGGTVSGGFAETRNRFDPYQFRPITSEDLNSEDKLLFVDYSDKLPANTQPLEIIPLPSGTPSLAIFSN